MNYYKLGMPVQCRFVEEYSHGNWDDSWCEVSGNSDILTECTLRAKRTRLYEIYWFITGDGFEAGYTKPALDLIFGSAMSEIEITEMLITHRGKKPIAEPEKVFRVYWTGDRVLVDGERIHELRDKEVPIGGDMSFVKVPDDFTGDIIAMEYFHSWYIISDALKERIESAKLQQIAIIPLDRITMDSGNFDAIRVNNVNRLMEQGLSREEAKAHIRLFHERKVSGLALKKWRDGHYIDEPVTPPKKK